jgi:hypothetical protein
MIHDYARGAFAHLNPEARQDLIQEVIANAVVAYVRLRNLSRFPFDWIVVSSAAGDAGRNFWRTAHLNSDTIACRSFFTVARSACPNLRWSNPSRS